MSSESLLLTLILTLLRGSNFVQIHNLFIYFIYDNTFHFITKSTFLECYAKRSTRNGLFRQAFTASALEHKVCMFRFTIGVTQRLMQDCRIQERKSFCRNNSDNWGRHRSAVQLMSDMTRAANWVI